MVLVTIRAQALALTLLAGFGVSAQAADAWFGVKTPTGLSDPHRPIADVKATPPAPTQFPADEATDKALRGDAIYRDVAAIVDFSKQSQRAGDKVWGRVTGFPAHKATIDWVAKQFNAAKLTG